MQQGDAVRLEASADQAEESIVIVETDVFEHADRDDAVKGFGQGAVVLETEVDARVQAFFLGAPLRHFELFRR